MSSTESCKCSTSGLSACNYGECNGHSSKETGTSNLHGPYCEKHKPNDDALATLVSSPTTITALPATTPSCRCPCKNTQSGAISSQKFDESSNDSLNTNECQCQFRSFDPTAPEEDLSMIVSASPSTSTRYSPPQGPVQAPVCIKCNSNELENNKTKNKLEQLRLVMQQKKERREARKLRGAPYGARVVGASSQLSPSNNGLASTTIPSQNDVVTANGQQQANQLVEEVDTAA